LIVRDQTGKSVAEIESDKEGNLLTPPLADGLYDFEFIAPKGFSIGAKGVGRDDSLDSDADPKTGLIEGLSVSAENPPSNIGVGLVGAESASSAVKRSPMLLHWNSFLDQTNILSLTNKSAEARQANVRVLNSSGEVLDEVGVPLVSKAQKDLVLNELPGFKEDAVGYVRVEFQDDNDLDASLNRYKINEERSGLNFTMTERGRELVKGASFLTFNTFSPGRSAVARDTSSANWLSVSNPSPSEAMMFTRVLREVDGTEIDRKTFEVLPLGRIDIEAGHTSAGLDKVGTLALIPANAELPYHANIDRYGTSIDGAGKAVVDFATCSPARNGEGRKMVKQFSLNQDSDTWMTLSNTSSESAIFRASFEDIFGNVSETRVIEVVGGGQSNILVDEVMSNITASGMVELEPMGNVEGIMDITQYYYSRASGEILEAVDGCERLAEPGTNVASYNTFLGQENWLRLSTTDEALTDGEIMVYGSEGAMLARVPFWLGPDFKTDINLSLPPFNIPADSFGLLEITRGREFLQGSITADVLRVRKESDGSVESFVFTNVE